MTISRRTFHGLLGGAALGGLSASMGGRADQDAAGAPKKRPHYLFEDPTFETIFLTSLGRALLVLLDKHRFRCHCVRSAGQSRSIHRGSVGHSAICFAL